MENKYCFLLGTTTLQSEEEVIEKAKTYLQNNSINPGTVVYVMQVVKKIIKQPVPIAVEDVR